MSDIFKGSGYFDTESGIPITPTGSPKLSERDNPYLTKAEYIETPQAQGSGITASSSIYTNGQLDKIILRASAWVNKYCRRWFDTQKIDEYQSGFTVRPFNPRLVTVCTRNSPIQSIESIYIQVLQWFIQVQTTPLEGSYLQIQPDWGTFKIVPLLSSAGSGTGSPIPAAILDKVPLGILWYRYTFGYGQAITGHTLSQVSSGSPWTQYQPSDYNYQLWAPDQTTNIYVNDMIQDTSVYDIDYPNGLVTFHSGLLSTDVVTADFTTNNTLPYDIKYATILLTTRYILQGTQNPMLYKSIGITGTSYSYGDYEEQMEEIKETLKTYRKNTMTII